MIFFSLSHTHTHTHTRARARARARAQPKISKWQFGLLKICDSDWSFRLLLKSYGLGFPVYPKSHHSLLFYTFHYPIVLSLGPSQTILFRVLISDDKPLALMPVPRVVVTTSPCSATFLYCLSSGHGRILTRQAPNYNAETVRLILPEEDSDAIRLISININVDANLFMVKF